MKKITLFTATALTVSCIGGQAITSQAASNNWHTTTLKGNRVIVTYGSGCDIQSLWDKLENCFPNINLPGCELPDSNAPETDIPETEVPETNAPETDAPEISVPEVPCPDAPIPDAPAPENPSPEIPSPELPDTEVPGVEAPENSTPDTPDNNDKPTEDSTNSNVHAFIKQVVNLVNAERAKEGLAPLTIDTKVQAAAQVRAMECEQSFSHTRPNGSSFATALKEQNVSYRSAGENIAWGQRSPEAVMNAWMNSAGHRANIMNPNFTTIGVGYYQNANGTNYWCQLFTR